MAVISKKGAKNLRAEVQQHSPEGEQIATDIYNQFQELHAQDYWGTKEVEALLLKQKEHEVANMGKPPTYPKHRVKFNPSGASKTVMDLYLKAKGYEERTERFPYQRRWTRNSTAVHDATQRDLLYSEILTKDPKFLVERTANGLPAWEDNVLKWVEITHKGLTFILNGKMDGILIHQPTGKRVGFELKTKSNSIGQVGYYRLKEPADYHVEQCTAYYLLTGIDEYIITYEGIAKSQWNLGAEAKPDLRTFYVKITNEMVTALLDKWAYVVECVESDTPPADTELGFFSGYGYLFEGENVEEDGSQGEETEVDDEQA